jgi:hypothetical protein
VVGIRGQYLLKRRIFNLVSIFSILTAIVWLFFFSLVHNMDQEARESEDIIVIEREEIL